MDRRSFLKLAVLGACCPLVFRGRSALPSKDENLVAILSDTHVGVHAPGQQNRGFQRSIQEVLAMRPLPANLLILGDFAYSKGLMEDYELLKKMIRPIEEAGIRWKTCMGNHDRRKAFAQVFPEQAKTLLPGKIVSLMETPKADFLLLDSLVEGHGYGKLGAKQEAWLASFLKARRKKTFVCAHHSILELKLARLLATYPCVVGFLNGHHHHWYQMLNFFGVRSWVLPSTGHWGDIGFTIMTLKAREAVLELHLHDVYPVGPKTALEREKARVQRIQQLKNGPQQGIFPL